jgi:hypothetical protein
MHPVTIDDKHILAHLEKTFAQKPCLDTRLKEALKPIVQDIGVLQPDQYHHLSQDTHLALLERLNNNEDNDEVKKAISDLITLLEEDMTLRSTLGQYMNRVKKV